ncbi:MAG: prepilin peptidase [Clostridia bacterium]|nr:prepilin peptidase [Clostridia bacterium]
MLIITTFILFISAVFDMKNRKIPNVLIILLLLTGVLSIKLHGELSLKLLGLLFPSVLLLIPYHFNKTGAGDIKLFAATGLILGLYLNIIVFVISLVLALVYSILCMVFKKSGPTSLPFAPFVSIAFLILILSTHFFS